MESSRFRGRRLSVALIVALIAVVVFVVDTVWVQTGAISAGDRSLELDVHRNLSRAWKPLMDALSFLGNSPQIGIAAVMVVLLLVWIRQYRSAIATASVPLLSGGLGSVLKQVFARPRPHLWAGVQHIGSYSFPSGHATAAGSLACVLTWVAYRLYGRRFGTVVGIPFGVFALGVGLSRVYLGVHWPSDVLGGYMVALFTTAMVAAITGLRAPTAGNGIIDPRDGVRT